MRENKSVKPPSAVSPVPEVLTGGFFLPRFGRGEEKPRRSSAERPEGPVAWPCHPLPWASQGKVALRLLLRHLKMSCMVCPSSGEVLRTNPASPQTAAEPSTSHRFSKLKWKRPLGWEPSRLVPPLLRAVGPSGEATGWWQAGQGRGSCCSEGMGQALAVRWGPSQRLL